MRFEKDARQLPVVWHQSLLTLVQRYKFEMTSADKARLRRLAAAQTHYLVTPEVLRELAQGRSRGEAEEPKDVEMGGVGGGLPGLPKGLGGAAMAGRLATGRPGEDPRSLPKVTLMEEDDF